MGGGATLISAQSDSTLRAAMPLAPWDPGASFSGIQVPTLVFACQNDNVAAVSSNASPFYNSIPATTKKEYLSIAGGDHFCANNPTTGSTDPGKFGVAWFKRWMDTDTRYDPWLCGASKATAGGTFNEVRSSCPF
jgi:triacylglycerol lipase